MIYFVQKYWLPGLHKFSINLGTTSKSQKPEYVYVYVYVCVCVCVCVCIYIYIRNGKNTDIHLFTNAEAATYMVESELHGMNLKMQ
jgi:hypothetical protein